TSKRAVAGLQGSTRVIGPRRADVVGSGRGYVDNPISVSSLIVPAAGAVLASSTGDLRRWLDAGVVGVHAGFGHSVELGGGLVLDHDTRRRGGWLGCRGRRRCRRR